MSRRAIVALAAAIALQASAGTPVAYVADVTGSATIEGDGALTFLTELEPGTRLFLGTGSRAAITFARSGREYTAAGPGEFLVAADELRAEKGNSPVPREVAALNDGGSVSRAARSATASTRMRGVRPDRPVQPSGALEYPVETRIATLQPMLRWQPPSDVRGAKVILQDDVGRELWKASASAASIKPPIKLTAATQYRWTVMTPRGVIGETRFETLPAEALARVEKSSIGAKSFSQRVQHALLLQELGAAQDARGLWAELARERIDLPELAALAR